MTNEELIKAIADGHNIQGNMYQLYSQNLTLLKQWSSKYILALGEDDVLQECYIALYNAVQGFDVDKGYKFTTFLQKAVKWHFSHILSCNNGVRIGINDRKLLVRYNALREKHYKEQGTQITIGQAADLLHAQQKILRGYCNTKGCSSVQALRLLYHMMTN